MKPATISAILIFCLISSGAAAASKERNWKEGKLLDINTETTTYYAVRITYTISGADEYIYTASQNRRSNEKRIPLTVNSAIRYALEKEKVYIVDEDGKEHDLKLEKRTLKDPH